MLDEKTNDQLVLKPPKSISDQIYEYLKGQILSNEIKSGQRLIENQVADRLKASRTPVREAFRRLEQDSLIEKTIQGGVIVSTLLPQEIQDVFGIREVLESYAIRLACQRIRPEDIEKLKDVRKKSAVLLKKKAFYDNNDILSELFRLNTLFHDTIYHSCRSHHLSKTIGYLRNIVLRSRGVSIKDSEFLKQVWEDHAQLITYIEQKNEKAATKLMQEHIRQAADYALKNL